MNSSMDLLKKYLYKDERLTALYDKTETAFQEKNLIAHGWDHVYRDIINAIRIGETEGADMNIVLPAIILHDIGFLYNPDPKVHNVVGADNCGDWLLAYGIREREHIKACILTHKGKYRGFAYDPASLEAKVVCDADLLEKVGYIGLLQGVRTFVEFAQASDPHFISLEKIAETLSHITDLPFYTESGRKIAQNRGGYLRAAFCEKALAEFEEYH